MLSFLIYLIVLVSGGLNLYRFVIFIFRVELVYNDSYGRLENVYFLGRSFLV